jgi:hypothetical protein
LVVFLLPRPCAAQSSLESTVKRLVDEPTFIQGFDIHELWCSGDRATVVALRLLDPEAVRTEKIVSRMLFLIETAFQEVDLIKDSEDRNPAVSLLFLNAVASQQYSPGVKRNIVRLRDSLIQVRKKVLAPRLP